MERSLEQIKKLDKLDPCSDSEAICKVLEELGEFTAEVNKITGRKHTTDTSEQIQANLLEECADTIQNMILVMSRFGITLPILETEILRKDRKWFKKMYIKGTANRSDFLDIFGEELSQDLIDQWNREEDAKKVV